MMIAASGTIRIPTRRRPLHAISQCDKNSGLNPGCKHDKMISPPTHRRARGGKGCRRPVSPAGHPARHRKRTVPGLRSVAVSNRMNPYRPRGGQHRLSLLSHRGRGTGAGGRPASRSRRKMTPNGPAIRPAGTIPSINPDHSPGNSWPSAGIPEFPRGRPDSWPYCAVPPAGRARNLPARSTGDTVSRNNYRPSQLQPSRPGQGAQPPITAVFRLPQVPRHLRRKGLATNFTGFGAVRALNRTKRESGEFSNTGCVAGLR
jgi:hypothetical protein